MIGFEINTEEWMKPAAQVVLISAAARPGKDTAMSKLLANDRWSYRQAEAIDDNRRQRHECREDRDGDEC